MNKRRIWTRDLDHGEPVIVFKTDSWIVDQDTGDEQPGTPILRLAIVEFDFSSSPREDATCER